MTQLHDDMTPETPVPFWKRPLQFDWAAFLKGGVQTTLACVFQDAEAATEGAANVLQSVSIEQISPEQRATMLIQNAVLRAYKELYESCRSEFNNIKKTKEEIENSLKIINENIFDIQLNEDFLNAPQNLPCVEIFQKCFVDFLTAIGISFADATTLGGRFRSYFVWALHAEAKEKQKFYEPLFQAIHHQANAPFYQPATYERSWQHYHDYIERQLAEPLLDEKFSLPQIFIPLNAYYKKSGVTHDTKAIENRIVVSLQTNLMDWAKQFDYKKSPLRILSGEPGAGKSAATKMFHQACLLQGIRAIYVPLQHFGKYWKDNDSLEEQITAYCQENLSLDDILTNEKKVLVIFDGLDELSKQGTLGSNTANQFMQKVLDAVKGQSELRPKAQLLVLIAGRPVAIDHIEHRSLHLEDTLHLLPYCVDVDEDYKKHQEKYIDQDNLLENNLRDQWWKTYGELEGNDYSSGLPKKLSKEHFHDLTARPLLNFLVAMVYEAKALIFTQSVSINEIYSNLVDQIFERRWGQFPSHQVHGKIKSNANFRLLLEETAITAWHDNGRVISMEKLEKRCEAMPKLRSVFKEFQGQTTREDKKGDISNLFVTFYFKTFKDTETTFEFTHKSFSEYLTACKIVKELQEIHNKLTNDESEKNILQHWLQVCGEAEILPDLFSFIKREIDCLAKNESVDFLKNLQQTIVQLINDVLKKGMPCELLQLTYKEQKQWARHAEHALLILHSCCAEHTEIVSNIQWPEKTSAGTWINELRGQRDPKKQYLLLFNHINFSEQILNGIDLRYANLSYAYLSYAVLIEAYLRYADLSYANLSSANLIEANLHSADLSYADLRSADLRLANLSSADLSYAVLIEADLHSADLTSADLRFADLTSADLRSADLTSADLRGTSFLGAKTKGTKFPPGFDLHAHQSLPRPHFLDAEELKHDLPESELIAEEEDN